MSRSFNQTFGVAGALIERDGKFLLVREAFPNKPDHPDKGKWNHPAGKIDVGEDPVEAVKREVREETWYDFTPTHLLGVYSQVRNDLTEKLGATPHALKFIFIGTISDGQTGELHEDVAEVKWFTPEEIEAIDVSTLRDRDIKLTVKQYLSGRRLPLDVIRHSERKS